MKNIKGKWKTILIFGKTKRTKTYLIAFKDGTIFSSKEFKWKEDFKLTELGLMLESYSFERDFKLKVAL